jgi:hypothetical protein
LEGFISGHIILTCHTLDDLEYFVDPLRPGEAAWNRLSNHKKKLGFNLWSPDQKSAFHLHRVVQRLSEYGNGQDLTRPIVLMVETYPSKEHWEDLSGYSDLHVILV